MQASRWRLTFLQATSTEIDTTFVFDISLVDPSNCWPVGYRNGSCCEQTLESIGISTLDGEGGGVLSVGRVGQRQTVLG